MTLKSVRLNNQLHEVLEFNSDFLLIRSKEGFIDTTIASILIGNSKILDVISSSTEILIQPNNGVSLAKIVKEIDGMNSVGEQPNNLLMPVSFQESDDWKNIIKATGIEREKYLEKLLALTFQVSMTGFMPGFVYCEGLENQMHCPRKSNPIINQLPNALAVGGPYLGMYSFPSPAGWQIIGQFGCSIFLKDTLPPTLLKPGDGISLKEVSQEEIDELIYNETSIIEYNG